MERDVFSRELEDLRREMLQQPQVLFSQTRIAMMMDLYFAGAVEFSQLQHDIDISDGAMATHIGALLKSGLIKQRKDETGTRVRTAYMITPIGMTTFESFLATMCKLKGAVSR